MHKSEEEAYAPILNLNLTWQEHTLAVWAWNHSHQLHQDQNNSNIHALYLRHACMISHVDTKWLIALLDIHT